MKIKHNIKKFFYISICVVSFYKIITIPSIPNRSEQNGYKQNDNKVKNHN